ncbi:hypothetical protein EFB08_10035 [Rufibacter latericius]|uniref:Uncharacterized protein n=1 Tax=Rufibacter latericius TaxID=2487040 RepID=A0A3M9MMQ3_9BACT|nr:hypothetical protein EFB08_10035 [Rufibacter latericius]
MERTTTDMLTKDGIIWEQRDEDLVGRGKLKGLVIRGGALVNIALLGFIPKFGRIHNPIDKILRSPVL